MSIGNLNMLATGGANINLISTGNIGQLNSKSEGDGSTVNAALGGFTGTANFESRTGGDSNVLQAGIMGTLNMLTDNHEAGKWGQSNSTLTTTPGSWTNEMNINTNHGSHFDGTINGFGDKATLTDTADKTVVRFGETSGYNQVNLNSIQYGDLEATFKGYAGQVNAYADQGSKLNIFS